MESVYLCSDKTNRDIIKILKEDSFMRTNYIIRNSGKKGFYLYIESTPEEMSLLEEKLKDLGAEKITGSEEESIIKDIKTEEENAATGMGMIFG